MVRMVIGVVSKERQLELLEEIREHGGDKADLETVAGLREFVKEADVILRHPKSGSVPSLNEIITAEQRQLLIAEVLPTELRDDEKTMWYLGKLDDIGGCSMIPVEKYLSNKKSFRHKCFICGYEVDASPSRVETNAKRDRRGCDGCNHRNGTSLEEAQRLFRYKNPQLRPLSGWRKKTDKILIECINCGYQWKTQPHYVLLDSHNRTGCPQCSNAEQNRKTHSEFLEEVHKANPDVEALGEYVNGKTKILVRHISCGYEWSANPRGLLLGVGCPKCRKTKPSNGQRKSHEQFVAEMKNIHPDIEVLSQYKNNRTKVKVLHIPCGTEFEITPSSLLNGRGCTFCHTRQRTLNSRKTHSQFIEEMKELHPDIEVLTEYINSKSKILVKHISCGYEWQARPNKLLSGQGCPKCNKPSKLTDQEYQRRLKDGNIIYIPLEPVQNIDAKISHLCPECDTTWDISPYNILLGYGCPRCRCNRQSYEEVLSDLNDVAPSIMIVGGYKSKNEYAVFECLECGHKWKTKPYDVLHGRGCPKCSRKKSFPEISVFYFLARDLPYEVLLNPHIKIPHLNIDFEADIFIPALRLFIEYDGFFWHQDPNVDKRYSAREEAIYNVNCKCLHIVEYKEFEKQEKSWMMEQPLLIEAKNHKANSDVLDRCIRTLETLLTVSPRGEVDCLTNKMLIEENYKKAPVHQITILENGSMKEEK